MFIVQKKIILDETNSLKKAENIKDWDHGIRITIPIAIAMLRIEERC